MKKIYFIILILVLIAGGIFVWWYQRKSTATSIPTSTSTTSNSTKTTPKTPTTTTPAPTQSQYALPVANFSTGQTKKVFGTYVTPQNSPVQPEKFIGYHTGVDIEQIQNNVDVPVYAINSGTVKVVRWVSGYGGVIIYSTQIDGQDVTILYGHIRLSSAQISAGDQVTKGEKLAVLGTGYSSETDGERKHLHFSIHRGSSIVYLGYVQNQSELSNWLNPDDIIK